MIVERVYALFGAESSASGGIDAEQRKLIAWIVDKGGAVSVRNVQRKFRYVTAEQAKQALQELVVVGVGSWKAAQGGVTMQFVLRDSSGAGKG